MSLIVPNLDRTQKQAPPLGEAVQKVQQYINANVAVAPGNKVPAPTFVTPATRQG